MKAVTPLQEFDKFMGGALQERVARAITDITGKSDAPKVLFASAVEASHTSILVGELAKILRQNGVEVE